MIKIRMNKGTTLIEILVVVAIIAALAAIAIPNFLKARIVSNDTNAQETLKAIGSAMENYNIINGSYPANMNLLLSATPPYVNRDYFSATFSGFDYTVGALGNYNYSITATPSATNMGSRSYTITTGGLLED